MMERPNVKNIAQILEDSASRLPNKICLIYENESLTYKALNEFVNKAGNTFLKLGVKKGDRVLVSLLNSPEFVISFFALAKIGAIAVTVNYMLTEIEDNYIWSDSEASLIITDTKKLSNFYKMTQGKVIILTIDQAEGEYRLLPSVLDFWDQLKGQSDVLSPCACNRDDVADILYTSGTTGKPKGAMLTHHSVLFCSSLYTDNEDMREFMFPEDSRFLVALPLYHCYGQNPCLITPLSVGATVIILDRFNTDKVFQSIATHRVTSFPGVPTMFAYLINGFDPKKHNVSSLRFCCSAGAPLSPEIAKAFHEKLGIEILNGYGITEASAQAIAHPLTPHKKRSDKFGSIGIPLRNSWQQTEAKIVDENGQELPANSIGELVIKGDHIMKGYWKSPEQTATTIRDGWLYTGDVASRDEDGYFYIVDRKKDMIIVGGENVYPREIEEVLYQNEKILEAAVIGVKDTIKGEAVKAVIALNSGSQATDEELIRFCAARLARFKVPRVVEIRKELPKSSTGKILKRLLK
jgi:long-chain acyl-CoA synthetase